MEHARHSGLVTAKLPALHAYHSRRRDSPSGVSTWPPRTRQEVFDNQGKCATCHVPAVYGTGAQLHSPANRVDSFQADRSPLICTARRRRGVVDTPEGGFYHDGRFAALRDVVEHYDTQFMLAADAGKNRPDRILKSL